MTTLKNMQIAIVGLRQHLGTILFFIYIYLPVFFSFERNETYISIKLNTSEYQT